MTEKLSNKCAGELRNDRMNAEGETMTDTKKCDDSDSLHELVRDELCLLRKIADEAKKAWDKGRLTVEESHLKNLLTDRVHLENVKTENS